MIFFFTVDNKIRFSIGRVLKITGKRGSHEFYIGGGANPVLSLASFTFPITPFPNFCHVVYTFSHFLLKGCKFIQNTAPYNPGRGNGGLRARCQNYISILFAHRTAGYQTTNNVKVAIFEHIKNELNIIITAKCISEWFELFLPKIISKLVMFIDVSITMAYY